MTADHSTRPHFCRHRRLPAVSHATGFRLAILSFFAAISLAAWGLAYRWGRSTTGADFAILTVRGASMAPTLWGPSAWLDCPDCRVHWRVHWQPELRPVKPVVCWNCGSAVPIDGVKPVPGDRVRLSVSDRPDWSVGDVVAIRVEAAGEVSDPAMRTESPVRQDSATSLSAKRIVAGPGQTVSHRDGLLEVDGHPIRFGGTAEKRAGASERTIWLPVHDDSFRRGDWSWWVPTAADGDADGGKVSPITPVAGGFRFATGVGSDDDPQCFTRLVYHHRAVHAALSPDVVRDDWPANVTEVRAMVPVTALRLTMRVRSGGGGVMEVTMRCGGEVRVIRRRLIAGTNDWTFDSGTGDCGTGDSVTGDSVTDTPAPAGESERTPVALRVIGGEAEITGLAIWRPLEYRISPRESLAGELPIRLGPDHWYLLGDNIPLSIDSRRIGPIPASRIVGRIDPVGYDDLTRPESPADESSDPAILRPDF